MPGIDQQLAKVCRAFAAQAADPTGFVPIHRLAGLFGAEIVFRPLLVEGMIAAPIDTDSQWRVLIDSDEYPVENSTFVNETATNPLQPRLRNTIAHELLHTLSFRANDFGFTLDHNRGTSRDTAVAKLEKETERFSPLLLIPEGAIATRITTEQLTLGNLLEWQRYWGVSREVLIARLGFAVSLADSTLRHAKNLRDKAVFLVEWANASTPTIRERPVFHNFSGNIVPSFLFQLSGKERPSLGALFPSFDFCINGGSSATTVAVLSAGTPANPMTTKHEFTCELEQVPNRAGERAFAVLSTQSQET